jgi:chromosome condensin MukBEF MukE localization factor
MEPDIEDALAEPVFAEIDMLLRQGAHIGPENAAHHSFLLNYYQPLRRYYGRYMCSLVHEALDESDFFFLASQGNLLRPVTLVAPAMYVGMFLAYMMTDPAYLSRRVPLERLIATMRNTLGEQEFLKVFAPRQRGRNQERDEEVALMRIRSALRTLERLGFVTWTKRSELVQVHSPIQRFVAPVRGRESTETSLARMLAEGLAMREEIGAVSANDEDGVAEE